MKVVYTPRHLGHEVTHETYLGVAVPANEVGERAEIIRSTLEADGGFELVEPTGHGLEPLRAVHDPGLVRFVEEAWRQAQRESARLIANPSAYQLRRKEIAPLVERLASWAAAR